MYASVATPVRHSIAQSSLSPDILAAKARVTEMRERLKKPVDHPTSEPSNADLMSVILGMRDMMALKEDVQVAKLETVQEIRTELAPIREHIADVEAKADRAVEDTKRALQETKQLHDRLAKVETSGASAVVEARLKRAESQIAALLRQSDKHDPAHKRLAFIGFSNATGSEARKVAMELFLREHAPSHAPRAYGNFTSWSSETSGRIISRVSYAEFESSNAAEAALKNIKAKVPKCEKDGVAIAGSEHMKIRRAKSQLNIDRDTALRKAEEIIKAAPAAAGKTVERKGYADRSVLVNGEVAFQQDKKGVSGIFFAPFADLSIP